MAMHRWHGRYNRGMMRLAHIPTPLDEAPRLSAEVGLRILVKRDDMTGLALGGNKARKLDHLMADAVEKGCTTVVTAGGAQSNFARMTAAAAASLGMACHLVLGGAAPAHVSGNLVLDRLFGAHLHFSGTEDWGVMEAEVERIAADIGPSAYPMPVGGATPVGALGYVHAADELLSQMDAPPDWIVLADGSGGTHAGLLAGLPASVRVLGIDVSRPPTPLSVIVPKLAEKTGIACGTAAAGGSSHHRRPYRPEVRLDHARSAGRGATGGTHRGSRARSGLHREGDGGFARGRARRANRRDCRVLAHRGCGRTVRRRVLGVLTDVPAWLRESRGAITRVVRPPGGLRWLSRSA